MLSRIGLRMAQSSRLAIRRPVNSPLLTTKRAFTNTASRLQGGQRRQSLKELSKKYGWTAFGVYMSLSALDLPLCFLFVHSMGQERVSEWELNVRKWVGLSTDPADLKTAPKEPADNGEKQTDWGFLLTEFGIAYAIHKSVFIFVRIPLTAAITPWTVKTLRNWGFNIGKGSANGKNLGQPVKKGQRWCASLRINSRRSRFLALLRFTIHILATSPTITTATIKKIRYKYLSELLSPLFSFSPNVYDGAVSLDAPLALAVGDEFDDKDDDDDVDDADNEVVSAPPLADDVSLVLLPFPEKTILRR